MFARSRALEASERSIAESCILTTIVFLRDWFNSGRTGEKNKRNQGGLSRIGEEWALTVSLSRVCSPMI